MTLTSAINIIPGQKGTYRYLQRRVTDLLAESGQIAYSARAAGTESSFSKRA
jgi:hypothetical protein